MPSKLNFFGVKRRDRLGPRTLTAWLVLSLSLSTTGCLSSLAKHNAALAAATTPVIDQAATAYHAAQALHDTKVDFQAVAEFDEKKGVDPESIRSFPSDQAIQVRLTVLEAFKCYVQLLVEITNGVHSPRLDAAATSIGGNLSGLSNTLAPTIDGALGIKPASGTTTITSGSTPTSSSATAAAPLVSTTDQNIISVSARALGEFLASRKIKKELPKKIEEMDPKLKELCELMEHDLDILEEQEQRDFEYIRDHQTVFIQAAALDPQERRMQIMKLPEMVRRHRETEEQLAQLQASIVTLYLTHRALAADAQHNNPGSLKGKLGDLAAAGNGLGKFYSSLPTQ